MSKQTPAERASEQDNEITLWARQIIIQSFMAQRDKDYATIAHLHRKLAGVMREYQKFKAKQEGGDATE